MVAFDLVIIVISWKNGLETIEMKSTVMSMRSRYSDQTRDNFSEERRDDAKSLVQPDTSITLVLEVIGLMCDGQRRSMQDYLREQPDNFRV